MFRKFSSVALSCLIIFSLFFAFAAFIQIDDEKIVLSQEQTIPVNLHHQNVPDPVPYIYDEFTKPEKKTGTSNSQSINSDWQNFVLSQIEKEEYNINFDESSGKFISPNRRNNITFSYFNDGFSAKTLNTRVPLFDQNDNTIPDEEKKYKEIDAWEVKLKLEEVGRKSAGSKNFSNCDYSTINSELVTDGNNAFVENENIRIDYVNDVNGMRQDFIIKRKPAGNGNLKLKISAKTDLKMVLGADALMFKTDKGEEMMKYSSLKVWDANGRELRAYFERSGKAGFCICVNDEQAQYPVTIDPLSSSPNWVVNFGYSFGSATSAAGDVNGDGYGDVIVGAKEHTTNFTNDGKVYLFLGSAAGLSVTPAWSSIGANQGSAYGNNIATAGDVNGDGYSDVIIGEPGYKVANVSRGRALVYLGSPGGLSASPDWTVVGSSSDLGRSVSTAGDVNGDGFSDVIVSTAYGPIDSATILGGAFLYLGSSSGLSSTPVWQTNGTKYFENFGNSICTAGDINGDGFSDVIIGAPQYSVTLSSNEGAAYAFYGSASGLSDSVDWFVIGQQPGYKFGFAVYTAGDVNGDGYSDVIIGSPDSGKAEVFHGSAAGLSNTSNWNYAGAIGSGFGYSVSTAGDFNGDGYSDVVIGAPGDSGKAYAFSGSPSGLSANSVWSVSNDGSTNSFGFTVRIAGDVNGDGYSDVLISGYSPKAFAYHGSPSGFPPANNWTYSSGGGSFGWTVASAGDINADGYSDVVIGAPDYDNGSIVVGRFFIFHGSTNGLPLTPTLIKTGTNSGASYYRVGRCVASAGDVNGDGYSDVAIGITNGVFGVNSFGGVEIYYGSSSGISSTPSWTKSSSVSGDDFGTSVASAGDVNGDGYSDIIVGASKLNLQNGAAYAFYGSENGLSSNSDWSAGGAFGSWYGYSVSSAGDVNGDGYADVVVGAPLLSSSGGAYVYHGSSSGLSVSANWQHTSPYTQPRYGISVACAGDVNGDGYSDVLIGLSKYFLFPIQAGAAACYYGSSTGLNPIFPEWFVEAPDLNFAHEFGGCVSSAGDVNGDGYSDVIVSAPYPFGDVYCYYGNSSGLPLSYNTSLNNPSTLRFGYSAASAGDVNGDGYSDILVGAYFTGGGHAFLYNGNSSSGKSSFVQQFRPNTNTQIGTGGWSTVNGEVKYGLFGRSPFGRVDGKMIYEHKMRGTSFSSLTNTTGSGSAINYQDFGLNGSVITANASGLNSDKAYKWKARAQYSPVNNPYQKLGPWRFYNSQYPLPFEGFRPKSEPVIPLEPAFALNFDGANDHISLPNNLTSSISASSGITIEFLYKGSDIRSALRFQDTSGFIIVGHNGNHVISTDGGLNNGIPVGGGVDDGQWHHVAVIWERNTVNGFRSYLDGFLVGQRNSADVSLPAITSGGTLGGSTSSGEFMNGSLDEVRLWNRAMTEEEIQFRSYCTLNGNINGLLANYHFDQGFANNNNAGVTTLRDTTSNSYNGTLNNFALQGAASNWIAPGGAPGFYCIAHPTLQLTVIPQGLHNSFGKLNLRDTVTVYLHSSTSPFARVDSARAVVDSVTFSGTFTFVDALPGSYYIAVKHRNSIETWSSYDELFNSWNQSVYTFTFGTYSAYGGNLAYLGPFLYAIYSGDINQDGTVDATDVSAIDNDASNFVSGYVVTDLTGDNFVDGTDFALADNNAANFVSAIRP